MTRFVVLFLFVEKTSQSLKEVSKMSTLTEMYYNLPLLQMVFNEYFNMQRLFFIFLLL